MSILLQNSSLHQHLSGNTLYIEGMAANIYTAVNADSTDGQEVCFVLDSSSGKVGPHSGGVQGRFFISWMLLCPVEKDLGVLIDRSRR